MLRRVATILFVVIAEATRVFLPVVLACVRRRHGERDRLLGTMVTAAVTRLGPCFVKLAQMFSYRTDLLSEQFVGPLAGLQDEVAYANRQDDIEKCMREFKQCHPEMSLDSEEPIGAGSVAIVFRARLASGQVVAVKVVREWVGCAIEMDSALVRVFVHWLARIPSLRSVPLVLMFDEVAALVSRQVDMIFEGEMLDRFLALKSPKDFVHTPRRITNVPLHRRILVMEWIGERRSLRAAGMSQKSFQFAADNLLKRLYRMIFVDGLVHCDLHPGNVLYRGDEGLTLVDLGLATLLTEKDRLNFRGFFSAFVLNDSNKCAEAMLQGAISRPEKVNHPVLLKDVAGLLSVHHGLRAGEFFVARFVFDVFELQRMHRLYAAPGFIAAIWALVMYEGLVRDLYPDLDFQSAARPYVVSHWISKAKVLNR
ncbi:MAG: AarF/UbiB family protein [Telluria sp.]